MTPAMLFSLLQGINRIATKGTFHNRDLLTIILASIYKLVTSHLLQGKSDTKDPTQSGDCYHSDNRTLSVIGVYQHQDRVCVLGSSIRNVEVKSRYIHEKGLYSLL